METLAILSVAAALVGLVGGGIRISQRLKSAASGPIILQRRSDNKTVTLPEHYDERAVRALQDLLA